MSSYEQERSISIYSPAGSSRRRWEMPHRNRHQQARPLNLPHVRDARLVRLEPPDDLPPLAHDADVSIARAEEQAVGAGADARDVVALKELAGVVVGQRHLRDVEEVERLPLRAELVATSMYMVVREK